MAVLPRALFALTFVLAMHEATSTDHPSGVDNDPLKWYMAATKRGLDKLTASFKGVRGLIRERAEELSHRDTDEHTIEEAIYNAGDRFGEYLAVPPEAVIDANMRTIAENVAMLSRAMARMARDQQAIFDETRLHSPRLSPELRPLGRCIDPVYAGDSNHDACTQVQQVMNKLPPSIAERFTERAERALSRERTSKLRKQRKADEV